MRNAHAPFNFMFLKERTMQAKGEARCAIFLPRRPMRTTVALGLLLLIVLAQPGLPQTTTPPLKFGENFFLTGDYVVGGVGLRGLGDSTGFATGTITLPDANSVPATGVPPGADIIGAFLYWQTVESSNATFAGQNGFFRGYPISGVVLGNPNAPVSWSSGGCSGSSQGSKTIRAYRADVLSLLPVDSNGNVQPNNSYQVRLADSGSGGGGTPLTLGATLVILYRVVSPDFPLKSVVIYDGSFAPANGSSTMTQTVQGFYQAAASPVSKLTHIVGNGQDNKFETVYLNSVALPSLYGSLPTFPGNYNGSWDNPTWSFSGSGNPVLANDASATTMVVPASSNSGCVSWGAVIFSTTVQNSDNDGILNVWKQNQGYCDAAVNEGVCTTSDPSWVTLPGATLGQKDLFAQMDYTCSIVNPDGTCNTTSGVSFLPPLGARTMVTNAFAAKGINVHLIPTNAIPEETCTDDLSTSPPQLCSFPNQPGVVTWKGGFAFLKNQPLNTTETLCEQNPATCVRRFQHGKKDSYHYVIAARALGVADWGLIDGSLVSVVASGTTVTFTTSTPHGLVAGDTVNGNGRVTVADAITNPDLNGTFYVQSVPSPTTFTIQIANAANATYTVPTDPDLGVASGQGGTGSGISELGGGDSLITLGLWLADGQTVPVQAGTFMHELGHSIALTHGGFFFPNAPTSYVATIEANCKSNFQSVMNYFFQVDLLLDGSGQQVLDYSGQVLNPLNEQTLSLVTGFPSAYSTKWYATSPPGGIGTAATRHCDGTPLSPLTDPQPTMYRVEGATNPISPAWLNGHDINFDGTINTNHRGYNDWANVDLRQVGATSSLSTVGAGSLSKGSLSKGSLSKGSLSKGSLSKGSLSKGSLSKGSLSKGTSAGSGEITHQTANSVTRPPRNLTLTPTDTRTSHSALVTWDKPTFGQDRYKVYRGANGASPTLLYEQPEDNTVTTYPRTYTDSAVSDCTTYTYVVSAVLVSLDPTLNGNESVPSNSVQYSVPCPPTGLTASLTVTNGVGSIALNWTAASTASGAIGQYKIYRDDGSGIQLLGTVGPNSYTDQPVVNNTTYTYYVTAASAILNDQHGCPAGQYCRESSAASTSISVLWTVDSTTTITSINPSPWSYLGQPLTVGVTVSPAVGTPPPTPTGTVTVSDSGKTICTITLSGGSGSCTGTPSILIGGLAAVGTRTISATYSGDLTFNGSSASKNQQVYYKFNGFLSPLKLSGYSGSFNLGKTIPIKWQLTTFSGTYITDSNVNNHATSLLTIYFNGPAVNGTCPAPAVSNSFKFLYSPQSGTTGGTTFRYDLTNNQFIFNHDTSKANFGPGCYTLQLQLDDGSGPKTTWFQER